MEDQAETWKVARRYAEQYANLPASFTTLIRSLRTNQAGGVGEFSDSSRNQLVKLLRSSSLKSPIYYAAKSFKSNSLKGKSYISSKDLVQVFSPLEVAVFVGLLYLYRKARRMCDKEQWSFLAESLHIPSEVGGYVGQAIPNIGLAMGFLAASIPVMGRGAFLMKDVKGFRDYRLYLKMKKLSRDFEYELNRWGCTHIQIASHLLVALGFSTTIVEAIAFGLEKEDSTNCPWKLAKAANAVVRWVDSLVKTGDKPEGRHDPVYYPEKEDLDWLISKAAKIVGNSSSSNMWLNKGKLDISPGNTPELFEQTASLLNAASGEAEEGAEGNEPEILDDLD